MKVTQLVFSWPREANYSCNPNDYAGEAIEDIELELSAVAPQAGDTRRYQGYQWQVAEVSPYRSTNGGDSQFFLACLTLDGQPGNRDDWGADDSRLQHVAITSDGLSFRMPTKASYMPKKGSEIHNEGEVIKLDYFEPVLAHPQAFEKVAVCWCSPVGNIYHKQQIATVEPSLALLMSQQHLVQFKEG